MISKLSSTTAAKIPKSIGVIMDGNRRYAKERGLTIFKGHEAGYEKLKEFVRWAKEIGIKTIYAYTFSTENWNRPKDEVEYLMELFARVVGEEAKDLIKEEVRIRFIGEIDKFSPTIQTGIKNLEKETAEFSNLTLALCVSYGGRAEILQAVNKILKENPDSGLNEENFSRYLWSAGLPDPELIIRTSGEFRTSGFLPWQSVYSEWFFTKTYWPALTKEEFEEIIKDFSGREIRRGK